MGGFKRFEDIECWKIARVLVNRIYEVTRTAAFAKDFALRDQIRRAVLSIMSNIAEGYERGRRREFAHFLSIAKGSVGEVRCQLYIAQDLKYIDAATFQELTDMTLKIGRMLSGLISHLGKQTTSGALEIEND